MVRTTKPDNRGTEGEGPADGELALDQFTSPALIADAEGSILKTNEAFDRLMGVASGAVYGHPLLGVLQPIGREITTLQSISDALRQRRSASGEVLMRTATERPRWFGLLVEPLAGKPSRTLVLLSDVSERVRANVEADRGRNVLHSVVGFGERLLRSRRWIQEMPEALAPIGRAIHAATISVYRLDPDAANLTTSWRLNEFSPIHRAWIDEVQWIASLRAEAPSLIDELPRPGVAAPINLDDGQVAVIPVDVGDERWGLLVLDRSDSSIPWTRLEQLACQSIAQNLAAAVARERREEAIASERTFVRQVLDGVDDGVWVSDSDERVVFANRVMHEILGAAMGTLIGEPIANMWARLAPDRPITSSFEVELGARLLFVRTLDRTFGDGWSRRFVVVTDISSRSDAERELKAAVVSAERASDAKTRFLGRVSHELRTPLQVVIGFARLAELDAPTPPVADHAREIISAAHHLERLVSDLIDLSSAESGDLALNFGAVELTALIHDAMEAMAPILSANRVKVRATLGRPVTVVADKGRVRQVVLNLLSNAVKFSPARSVVRVEVSEAETATHGIVRIRDQGRGFPANEFDRIFVPFERLSNAVGTEGVGLGLAMSHMLAQRMGGELLAENAPDGGALLTLSLPLIGQATGNAPSPR
jgi:signal transduction histidine kinase